MALPPNTRKLGLTRDQLASFLQDHEQIKQFENLFALVDSEVAPNAVSEATILAGNADARAQQALDSLERIANALELLAAGPAQQNNNSVATDYVDFNVNSPLPTALVGRAFWDGGQTLNIQQTLNVAGKINEDNFYYIKADSTISKGQLVMFTGAVGASGVLRGAPASGLGVNDGVRLMGIAAENIATNGFGMVQWSGTLRGFNTTGAPYGETWADGDILYYNPAFAGGLTKNEPIAPNVRAVIAAVVNAGSGGSGSVTIRLSVGSVLGGTDSNVYVNALTGNDLLIYDGVDQRWENRAASSITVGTATNLAGGLANQIPYQTAPGTTGFASVGTGLLLSGGVLSNSAPDQIVALTAGTGISVTGTYPNFTITNTAPDQIVSLTGAGTTVVTGTYPNFTITSNDQYVGTVTSVSGTGSVNGITLTGTVTSSGSLTLGGTLSGVSLTTQVTGTLPTGNGGTGTATSFTAGSVVFAGASGVYSQDNSNFFWDNTNKRLGLGTSSPGATFDVAGNIRMSAANPNIELNNGGPMIYVPAGNTLGFATGGGPSSPQLKFQIGPAGQWGIAGATYGSSGQVFASGGASSAPSWLTLASVATSGSFSDLSNQPGIKTNGQNVIAASKTLGAADKGTNILIVTAGITLTFPASGFASGEGFAISNVSGGNVTLSVLGGSDFGSTLPNNGSFFAFCDGGSFWRQYCYSTSRL